MNGTMTNRFLVVVLAVGALQALAATPGGFVKPSPEALKEKLSAEQYRVTQENGTERPFRNAYFDHHEEGLYVDVVSGEPLFLSKHKFESGTGWPSFFQPADPSAIVEKRDVSHGMVRVEVRSKQGDSHLGHLFDDGPKPTGQRYCINSAALRFVPKAKLAEAGYGVWLAQFEAPQTATATGSKPMTEPTKDTIILAGGCFWGMEELIRKIPGVLETDVGYAGGASSGATYEQVKTGKTGHAEAVRVVYDPTKLKLEDLLEVHFFRMHDPTTVDRQGNDVGSQYRSAIFYTSDAQRQVAEAVKAKVDKSGKWKRPVVTQVVAAGPFSVGEAYHQDYLQKHPGGYTCHFYRD